jgi:hypothetical protein
LEHGSEYSVWSQLAAGNPHLNLLVDSRRVFLCFLQQIDHPRSAAYDNRLTPNGRACIL